MEITIFTLLYVMVTPLENTQTPLFTTPPPPPLPLCSPSYRRPCPTGTDRSVTGIETERQERLGEEHVEAVVAPLPSADLPADESVRFHISHINSQNK